MSDAQPVEQQPRPVDQAAAGGPGDNPQMADASAEAVSGPADLTRPVAPDVVSPLTPTPAGENVAHGEKNTEDLATPSNLTGDIEEPSGELGERVVTPGGEEEGDEGGLDLEILSDIGNLLDKASKLHPDAREALLAVFLINAMRMNYDNQEPTVNTLGAEESNEVAPDVVLGKLETLMAKMRGETGTEVTEEAKHNTLAGLDPKELALLDGLLDKLNQTGEQPSDGEVDHSTEVLTPNLDTSDTTETPQVPAQGEAASGEETATAGAAEIAEPLKEQPAT